MANRMDRLIRCMLEMLFDLIDQNNTAYSEAKSANEQRYQDILSCPPASPRET